jgi:protein-S-isoprenylcysteine O-methyltransferase Ste14
MVVKLIIQTLVWFGAMGAVMFLAAGTLAWPGAWVFLALMLGLSLVTGPLLAKHDPGLLNERLKSPVQKGQTAADKIITSSLFALIFVWLALMGFDVRFGWSSVPAWVQAVGVFGVLLSVWIIYRTMRENSFAAPVVKIQADRGHSVISTGPYAYVRHPMYFGAIFYFVGTALLLGSWWGIAFGLVLILLLCVRIPLEEKVLRAELQGYDDYAARVRYRLIPLVW